MKTWGDVNLRIKQFIRTYPMKAVRPAVNAGLAILAKEQRAKVPARWKYATRSIGKRFKTKQIKPGQSYIQAAAGTGVGFSPARRAAAVAARNARTKNKNPKCFGITPSTIHWFVVGTVHRDRFQNVPHLRGLGKKTRWKEYRNKQKRITHYDYIPIPDARDFTKWVGRMGTHIPLMNPVEEGARSSAPAVYRKIALILQQKLAKFGVTP